MINAVRDNAQYEDGYVCITSGSFGEGLEMKGSDIDIMYVCKQIEIHENMSSVVKNNNKIHCSINMEDTSPGFTYLSFEFTNAKDVLPICVDVGGKLCLSNVMFKQLFAYGILADDHGPCLSDTNGILDVCYCLHSESWITSANHWITRSNYSWPSAEVKQNIIYHGVLCVPIGVKGSENENVQWRLSFSVGEKLLIYTFSHTQLLCYALLKILLKDVINIDMQCKDLLCSYFLKTIIFWVSEESHPSVWTPTNLLSCFMRCFRRLIHCVKYSNCPHYFIPENNLFENKIVGIKRQILLNRLYTLHSYDWRCIFFSPQITQLELSPSLNIPLIAFTCSFQKVVKSRNLFTMFGLINMISRGNLRTRYVRIVHYLLRFQSSRIRLVHLYLLSLVCEGISQDIPLKSRYGNKYQYKQYNTCLNYLLQNIHHDSVSGWLLLASFFCRTQHYMTALDVTFYALSKCTFEKLCLGNADSCIQIELLSLQTIRKKGIINLIKLLGVKLTFFADSSFLIPTELQMKEESGVYIIPTVVYAHFIRVLCHYYLNNVRKCQESIRDLQLTIAHNYLIPNIGTTRASSLNCLGVALQLLGETENAKEAFLNSIQLWPEPQNNTAFKRLYSISLI